MLKSKIYKTRYLLFSLYQNKLKKEILKSYVIQKKHKNNEKNMLLSLLLSRLSLKGSKSKQNIRCFVTNRAKSVYKNFSLSRIFLRNNIRQGFFSTFHKNSW